MKIFLNITCFILVLSIFMLALIYTINRPIMYKSWSTKQCVYIESSQGKIEPCRAINDYDLIWVE